MECKICPFFLQYNQENSSLFFIVLPPWTQKDKPGPTLHMAGKLDKSSDVKQCAPDNSQPITYTFGVVSKKGVL